MNMITYSQRNTSPIPILEKRKLKPNPSLERLVNMNIVLQPKQTTLENIKAEVEKYKSLLGSQNSLIG